MTVDDLDEALDAWQRLSREAPDASGQRQRRQRREQFIMLPLAWKERFATARHVGTLKLAHHLLYLGWKSGERLIRVSNAVAKAAGLTRRSKWNALTELEQLGVVVVERRARRSPAVTILVPDTGNQKS
jgi:hypothetical protein